MNYYKLLYEYKCIKKECPTYRFGQHVVNSLGLRNQQGLFFETDDDTAALMFFSMCDQYHWDISQLPEFNKNEIQC